MNPLVIIVIDKLNYVFFFILSSEIWFGHVEPRGCGKLWALFFVLLFLQEFLFLFLMTLLRGFRASGVVVWAYSLRFLTLELGFLISKIFYWVSLSLNLACSSVDRMGSLLIPVIHFLGVRGRLKSRFGLDFNSFPNKLFLGIKFWPSLLHLGLNRGLEVFTKKLNNVSFFWNLVSIKFQQDGLEVFQVCGIVPTIF